MINHRGCFTNWNIKYKELFWLDSFKRVFLNLQHIVRWNLFSLSVCPSRVAQRQVAHSYFRTASWTSVLRHPTRSMCQSLCGGWYKSVPGDCDFQSLPCAGGSQLGLWQKPGGLSQRGGGALEIPLLWSIWHRVSAWAKKSTPEAPFANSVQVLLLQDELRVVTLCPRPLDVTMRVRLTG